MKSYVAKKLIQKFEGQPIFVVGAYRSGTSILLQALGKHPLILSAKGEAPLINFCGNYISKFEDEDKVFNRYLEDSNKVEKQYIYDCFKKLNIEICFGKNYGFRQLVKTIYYDRFDYFKKKIWSAKVFPDIDSYRGLKYIYPKAKFVYIVRNGIDVVESRRHFAGFKHESFETHCHNWTHDSMKFKFFEESEDSAHIYYEQLLENPDLFFDKIFDSLSIPKDSSPAKYARGNLIHPLNQKDKRGVDAAKILKSRSEPHEKWTDKEKQLFIDICSDEMQYHGYKIPFS